MTSRTTPVGIIVLALAGLVALGCNAPTSAVFEALIAPAGTTASPPPIEASETTLDVVEDQTWWPHPDGYAMDLPAGWSGLAVGSGQTQELLGLVAVSMPGLADRIDTVLDGTSLRVSAIAADPAAEGDLSPILLVLAQPTEGRRAREVKAYVREEIMGLPGLTNEPISPHDVVLETAKGVRFDYSISDPDLGEVRVRSYLFRFGREVYLVNFIVGAELADEAEAIFDEIADSLRFGV